MSVIFININKIHFILVTLKSESFIDVSVIYELCIFAGNLAVRLVAGRNGHTTEIDLCLTEVQLFLPWVKG